MTTPEDPGKYSRLSGAEPNRFVSGAALFYLLGDCSISKDRQKKKPIAVRCNRLMPKGWPFPDSGTVTSHGRIRVTGDIPRRLVAQDLRQDQAVQVSDTLHALDAYAVTPGK